jgi:hypothetical protein
MTERAEKRQVKDYLQTLSIILTIACSCYMLYNGIVKSNNERFEKIDNSLLALNIRMSSLEKDVTIMKTILITKNFAPPEIFASKDKETK